MTQGSLSARQRPGLLLWGIAIENQEKIGVTVSNILEILQKVTQQILQGPLGGECPRSNSKELKRA
jgi:hypothetical protein